LIQSDLGNPKTHARIIGLGSNEKISYPLRDPENYTDIIEIVKRLAKKRYQKKVLGIYFGPKIETRSYSLM
ncbi:MAG: hypothetical protein GTN59_17035, partial [Candidatus Dadabacteria bacterium]|nr:hypothetical protein [Candidatus Dadabacteria bacterium]